MPGRKRKLSTPVNSLTPLTVQHPPHPPHPPNAHFASPRSLDLLNVLDPDRSYPIYDRLCSYLPLPSILSLSKTCKSFRLAYLQRWDVDRRLDRFVQSPKRLRSQLAKHGSLISGSFALQVFAQRRWPDSDLDIFVERGPAVESFEAHLCQEEHYSLQSTTDHRTYAMQDLIQIRTYRRPSNRDPVGAKVQIIVCRLMPILATLSGFYTTALLNVISWNKAYAIFAHDTFLGQKTYMLKPMDTYFETLLRKYARRGWHWEEIMRPADHFPSTSIQPLRRLGDRFTWTLPLSTHDVERSPQLDLVLEYAFFTLRPRRSRSRPDTVSYLLSAQPFQHISLDHRYVRPGRLDWTSFLADRLCSYANMDLLAMEPEDRPAWFTAWPLHKRLIHPGDPVLYSRKTLDGFKRPSGWRTFDDMIPTWFNQWYQCLQPELLEFDSTPEDQP